MTKKYPFDYWRAPLPADLGYHSPVPFYDGQGVQAEQCLYIGGGPCYYAGSALNATRPFEILIAEGDEGLWQFLEQAYQREFVREGVELGGGK